ncbi:MAG: hypothetical protein QOG54_1080 [Actinomycetota bacterium]|jgi:hypothetical protein|nr:hypothetical protein [Actinomycetota bacterium]
MTDSFERRLQEEMHRSTERLSLPPAPDVRRRVRVRQAFTVLAAIVALGAIGVAGAATVDAFRDKPSGELGPAGGDDATPGGRGSGGTFPCETVDTDYQCIAEGSYDGVAWSIGVQMNDFLCMTQSTESPTQGGVASGEGADTGCMAYSPNRAEVNSLGTNDPDGYFASGYVGANISSAIVETESGEGIDLQLYPAPSGFPISDVKFFAVFLPPDATDIVGYSATGNEVDRRPTDPGKTSNDKLDPVVQDALRKYNEGYLPVERGEIGGYPWILEARLGLLDLPGGEIHGDDLCSSVSVGTDVGIARGEGGLGGGGNCFSADPSSVSFNPMSLGYTRLGFQGDGILVVFGAITPGVDHLFVEVDGGGKEQGYISEVPTELETNLRLFTVFIETQDANGLTGRISTFDRDGAVIDDLALCTPRVQVGLGTCRTDV